MDSIIQILEKVLTILGLLVAVISAIVKAMPTMKEGTLGDKIMSVVQVLSIFNPNGKKVVSEE